MIAKTLNRFERSCIRSFFTLPPHLKEYPNSTSWTEKNKSFSPSLLSANSIQKDEKEYYIIWLDSPEEINTYDRLDLSFRDFSYYSLPRYVLIRKAPREK